jgi:hypothetical protein
MQCKPMQSDADLTAPLWAPRQVVVSYSPTL